MPTVAQNNEIITLVDQSGLESQTATYLKEKFLPFFDQAEQWREKAKTLVVTDESQVHEMKIAREARLALRNIRINADKTRKELKEDSLRYGKAVQGVYNVIDYLIAPIEKHLEDQEKFAERRAAERKQKLREDREAIAIGLRDFIPYGLDFGTMSSEDFDKLINGAQLQRKAAEQEFAIRESARIAKEKAEAEEREKIRLENERLRKEAEEREKQMRLERQAAEKKLADQRAKAEEEKRKLQAEQKKRLDAEIAEKKKIELELLSKQQAEEKAEAERFAAIEAELSMGDKSKFQLIIRNLTEIKSSYLFKSKKYKTLYTSVNALIDKIIDYAENKMK
jgi:hypothetical protein